MTVQQELRRLRRRVKKLEARNARISEALMVDAIRVLTKAEPVTPPGRLPSLDDPIANPEEVVMPTTHPLAGVYPRPFYAPGPWLTNPEVRASNKPETNEGEAVPIRLVEPYLAMLTPEGIFQFRPGERVAVRFDGPMRALWERQYRAQEDWKEHVARNKVRAPRRPELSFLFGSYPSLPFREDPELEARELFFLNPDRYFYGKIEPTE